MVYFSALHGLYFVTRMAKLKTTKAMKKRIDLRVRHKKGVKSVKMIRRKEGQNHFNAKERGNTVRLKRTDVLISPTYKKTVLRALPNG